MENYTQDQQIKSKARVKELAEVFTAKKEVNDMLDLCEPFSNSLTATFLEPACGNGNFLEEILNRKLKCIDLNESDISVIEFDILTALSTIYGIDISNDNVFEARLRLKTLVLSFLSFNFNTLHHTEKFLSAVDYILSKNIILGDTVNEPGKIIINEFTRDGVNSFTQKCFYFSELLVDNHTPFEMISSTKYFDLGWNLTSI